MDYSPCNSPCQNTRVGSLSLLQGLFPTQRWNPGLLHCKQILYQLSHTRTLIHFSEHTSLLPQSPLGSLSSPSIYSLCIHLVLLREADERKMWYSERSELMYFTENQSMALCLTLLPSLPGSLPGSRMTPIGWPIWTGQCC